MSNRRLLIALACLALPGLALAAKWEKVGEAGPVQVYVDKESIRKNGTEARADLEWRWSRPTEVPDADPPRQYRLERQVQISNCSNRAYAVAEGTRYADDRGLDPVVELQVRRAVAAVQRRPGALGPRPGRDLRLHRAGGGTAGQEVRSGRMTSRWIRLLLAASLGWLCTASHALVFAVNEGVTYRVGNDEIRARYALIATDLAKMLRQPVTVEPIGDYPTLRKGLAGREYDLAFVHPAHLSMLAIRDSGYRLLAVTKGFQNYTASFMVRADSPLKTLKELNESTLGAPDEDSITSWMVRATLRDTLGPAPRVRYSYTRYQDAVPFFVEHGLTKAGASAANSVVKGWQAKGGRILGTSRPVPIKHVLAGSSLSPEQVQQVREYFLALDGSEEGKKRLEPIKYQGFAPYDEAEMLAIGKWLGL